MNDVSEKEERAKERKIATTDTLKQRLIRRLPIKRRLPYFGTRLLRQSLHDLIRSQRKNVPVIAKGGGTNAIDRSALPYEEARGGLPEARGVARNGK